EARWSVSASGLKDRGFARPLWLGETDISGRTVLVDCEQGLGDSIQMSRYLPLLAPRGCRVVFEVQPPLAPLFRDIDFEIVVAGKTRPDFDVHCPIMSLPLALGATPDTIPPACLDPDPTLVDEMRRRLGAKRRMRIGLSWSGSPINPADARRSVP